MRQPPELSLAEALLVTYRSIADKHAGKKVKGGTLGWRLLSMNQLPWSARTLS
jgi:hypothetical protein